MRLAQIIIFGAMTVATATPACAQGGQSIEFRQSGWAVGSSLGPYTGQGVSVTLEVTQRDTILGVPSLYFRGRFCNQGAATWNGGQRISNVDRQTTHASLNIPIGECRTWSEWLPADVGSVYVYVRRDQ